MKITGNEMSGISLAHANSLYSKLFWHKCFMYYPISKMFAAHFTTNLWLNVGKKMVYHIILNTENAFSEVSFRTLEFKPAMAGGH